MSIVPKNPAPVPQMGMAGGYNQNVAGGNAMNGQWQSEYDPYRVYNTTDWGRLGGMRPVYGETDTDAPGPINYWMPINDAAIPPGFSQASMPTRYGAGWRGAAFGPQGRLSTWGNANQQPPPGGMESMPGGEPIVTYLPGWGPDGRLPRTVEGVPGTLPPPPKEENPWGGGGTFPMGSAPSNPWAVKPKTGSVYRPR